MYLPKGGNDEGRAVEKVDQWVSFPVETDRDGHRRNAPASQWKEQGRWVCRYRQADGLEYGEFAGFLDNRLCFLSQVGNKITYLRVGVWEEGPERVVKSSNSWCVKWPGT